jgi:membrane associated rhomboid family serine protease
MTTMLLVSLVVCYVVQVLLESSPGFGPQKVDRLFALSVEGLKAGRIYQLLTFQFMHVGLLHIVGNMFGLYFFGRAMEEALGRREMLLLYLMSGTLGGLLQVALGLVSPGFAHATVMGASAGVFGLIAAFATREPNYPITLLVFFVIPVTLLAKWLLLIEGVVAAGGLYLGWSAAPAAGSTAHGAHLGGMLTGIAFIKWGGWLRGAGGWWAEGARRRFSRQPARATVLRPIRRARKSAEELPPAEFISREVDPILEKISAHGIHSLTEREREILEAARSKMARR